MNLYLSWIQSESEIKHSCQHFGKFSMNFETDKSVKFVFAKNKLQKQRIQSSNRQIFLLFIHSLAHKFTDSTKESFQMYHKTSNCVEAVKLQEVMVIICKAKQFTIKGILG